MSAKIRKTGFFVSLIFTLLFITIIVNMFKNYDRLTHSIKKQEPQVIVYPEILGFSLDSLSAKEGKIKKGEFFSDILQGFQIPYNKIAGLAEEAKNVLDVRKLVAGNRYFILSSNDSLNKAKYFIYEKNPVEYYVFHLNEENPKVYKKEKPVQTIEKELTGTIEGSLYQTLQDNGGSPELAVLMSEVFAWTIDFYRLQKEDAFSIIYEEQMVDTLHIGISSVKAIKFTHKGEDFYAFNYKTGGKISYFDENGKSLKKAFLKSPVKFSRISSHFNLKRFHPVQKRYKSHLGTDYAANYGTPILAVGDGTILEAQHKIYNGNYVKIKHNETYTTQYLHMSKFAAGIRKGAVVKQGDVIGYVGSTGLATGPHVCFRFWKNGEQVNHLQEKFIGSDPINPSALNDYLASISTLKGRLEHTKSPLVSRK